MALGGAILSLRDKQILQKAEQTIFTYLGIHMYICNSNFLKKEAMNLREKGEYMGGVKGRKEKGEYTYI